jgi:hypothetical protein
MSDEGNGEIGERGTSGTSGNAERGGRVRTGVVGGDAGPGTKYSRGTSITLVRYRLNVRRKVGPDVGDAVIVTEHAITTEGPRLVSARRR